MEFEEINKSPSFSNINYFIQKFKEGSKIHIKKENQGKFTDYCGGTVTAECISRGKQSSDPAVRKRATFADNARKWAKGGILETLKIDPDIFTTYQTAKSSKLSFPSYSDSTLNFEDLYSSPLISTPDYYTAEELDAITKINPFEYLYSDDTKDDKKDDVTARRAFNPTTYLPYLRNRESGGRDDAQNAHSTAKGRYQFIDKTWATIAPGENVWDGAAQDRAALKYARMNLDYLKEHVSSEILNQYTENELAATAHYLGHKGLADYLNEGTIIKGATKSLIEKSLHFEH